MLGAVSLRLLDRFTQVSFLAFLGVRVPLDISFIRYALAGAIMILVIALRPPRNTSRGHCQNPTIQGARKEREESRRGKEKRGPSELDNLRNGLGPQAITSISLLFR